jgi:hypothetical protein
MDRVDNPEPPLFLLRSTELPSGLPESLPGEKAAGCVDQVKAKIFNDPDRYPLNPQRFLPESRLSGRL